MKYCLYILTFIILLTSCVSTQNDAKSLLVVKNDNLSNDEIDIINDFLNEELTKEIYNSYKDYEIVLIEEALAKNKSLDTYLYSYEEHKSMDKIHKRGDIQNMYFLDSLQIIKIKEEIINEPQYHWKVDDFKRPISLLKFEDLRKIINTNAYSILTKKLIIYISKPLIIDAENAFISFEIGNGQLGFSSINHFSVHIKKINEKWTKKTVYYDGVYY